MDLLIESEKKLSPEKCQRLDYFNWHHLRRGYMYLTIDGQRISASQSL